MITCIRINCINQLHPLEFDGFRKKAGLNSFTISPTKWVKSTNALGMKVISGRYSGTCAISGIVFEFASWVSVEFKLYFVREFQRLKADEQKQLAWSGSHPANENSRRYGWQKLAKVIVLSLRMINK